MNSIYYDGWDHSISRITLSGCQANWGKYINHLYSFRYSCRLNALQPLDKIVSMHRLVKIHNNAMYHRIPVLVHHIDAMTIFSIPYSTIFANINTQINLNRFSFRSLIDNDHWSHLIGIYFLYYLDLRKWLWLQCKGRTEIKLIPNVKVDLKLLCTG